MSVYKVDICGVTTSKLPVLKDDEKEELFEKIKKGDKAAREKYIRGNLRLVLSVIRRFSNHNENMDDLFQIGCIGLMKSIDNFDPTIGVKFSTYAVPMIIGEVRRYLRDNSAYRIPRSLRDTVLRLYTRVLISLLFSMQLLSESVRLSQSVYLEAC
jgi:RNA polymerase sporulation-specific sigma factor